MLILYLFRCIVWDFDICANTGVTLEFDLKRDMNVALKRVLFFHLDFLRSTVPKLENPCYLPVFSSFGHLVGVSPFHIGNQQNRVRWLPWLMCVVTSATYTTLSRALNCVRRSLGEPFDVGSSILKYDTAGR